MSVATSTAVAIGLGAAGAVSSVVNAHTQRSAAKDAAKIETDASSKASELQAKAAADTLAFQKQQWEAAQQNSAPFVQLGQGAAKRLSDWFGMPPTGASASGGSASAPMPAGAPAPGTAVARTPNGPMPLSAYMAQKNNASIVPDAPPAAMPSAPASATPGAAPTAVNSSGYVTMRSPDGRTTKAIPQEQVAHYESLGAQRVA